MRHEAIHKAASAISSRHTDASHWELQFRGTTTPHTYPRATANDDLPDPCRIRPRLLEFLRQRVVVLSVVVRSGPTVSP